MKLFAIYIGGEFAHANIEVHDMRFVVAESINDTHVELKRQWWGKHGTLHIDCWSEITQADGYAVTLKQEPATDINKLYYVNLGGYDPSQFLEVHKNMFVVADTASKAKVRALKTVRHWDAFHKDDMYEAEQSISISETLKAKSLYIHLEKIEDESPSPFICFYKKLGL